MKAKMESLERKLVVPPFGVSNARCRDGEIGGVSPEELEYGRTVYCDLMRPIMEICEESV